MSGKPPRTLRRLIAEVRGDGWDWQRLGSGHIRFFHPETPLTVTAAATSNDVNMHRILRRQMARSLEQGRGHD